MDKKSFLIGFFDSPDLLLKAVRMVRTQGYSEIEVFSPFPIHGMDEAQGLARSNIPFVTFAAACTGAICGFVLQYWTSAIDWPINVGGKPMNSWPAFIPITFECTILFAGIATAIAMFWCNRLPNTQQKAFHPKITCDRFALVLGNSEQEKKVLEALGAKEIQQVDSQGWF